MLCNKHVKLCIALIILIPYYLYPDTADIGKILNKTGTVKKSNINCDDKNCGNDGTVIFAGDRITTGKKSSAEIILHDGTAIRVYENSDIIINNILSKKNKTPTGIFSDYGKFKIIQQNDFLETSLIFKTRTAVIKSVCSSMSVITGNKETGIFIYKGEAGFASIDPSIIEAFIIKSGYESFLEKKHPPVKPHAVPVSLRLSWLQRHFLSPDLDRIFRVNKKDSAIEWFFIEKN